MGEEATKQAEEKKKEEKIEEKKEEDKAEEKKVEEIKPPSLLVLYVDLHCVGCAKKIERSILKVTGVEGVVIDMIKNQVTIKGIVDPQAICNKIIKKTKRKAHVLSPPEAAEPMPLVVTSQVSGAITVDLNVNMHCEACAEQLKKKILQMRGVEKAETELSTGKVKVTGTMDGEKLVEYVYRRTRKQARIVPQPLPEPVTVPEPQPQPEPEKKEEEKGPAEEAKKEESSESIESIESIEEEEEEEKMKRMMHSYQLPLYMNMMERLPPPQLFSDENPNACSIS